MKKAFLIVALSIPVASYFSLRKTQEKNAKKAFYSKNIYKVMNKDFRLRAYKGVVNTHTIKSDSAYLKENESIFLKGKVEILKKQGKRETLKTDLARLVLAETPSGSRLQFSKIKTIELLNDVNIYTETMHLFTKKAAYGMQSRVITSTLPVRVQGPGQLLKGDSGFYLNLSNEELEIYGRIEGSFESPK